MDARSRVFYSPPHFVNSGQDSHEDYSHLSGANSWAVAETPPIHSHNMGLWVFVIRNIRSNQLLDYSSETVLTGWKTLVVLGNIVMSCLYALLIQGLMSLQLLDWTNRNRTCICLFLHDYFCTRIY